MEVRVHKEHDECRVKQVVEDEVAADTSSCGNDVGTAGEERCDVSKLEDEENNPVDISEDVVHGKGAGIQIVLIPYAPADVEAIVRLVNGIVDSDDDGQKP